MLFRLFSCAEEVVVVTAVALSPCVEVPDGHLGLAEATSLFHQVMGNNVLQSWNTLGLCQRFEKL
jgi:hypothetical protein